MNIVDQPHDNTTFPNNPANRIYLLKKKTIIIIHKVYSSY